MGVHDNDLIRDGRNLVHEIIDNNVDHCRNDRIHNNLDDLGHNIIIYDDLVNNLNHDVGHDNHVRVDLGHDDHVHDHLIEHSLDTHLRSDVVDNDCVTQLYSTSLNKRAYIAR